VKSCGKGFKRTFRVTAPWTLSAAILASAAQADSILAPVGPVGAGDRIILVDALVIMLAIVVPTMAATLAFAWWYRASNTRAVYRPDFTYSGKLELLVWSIPTLVIFFAASSGSAATGSTRSSRCRPRQKRSKSRPYPSTGNGSSSIPSSASPASTGL